MSKWFTMQSFNVDMKKLTIENSVVSAVAELSHILTYHTVIYSILS